MKTFDEFFNTDIFSGEYAEECKRRIEAAEKEINDRLAEKTHVTRKEIEKAAYKVLGLTGEELDFWDRSPDTQMGPFKSKQEFLDWLHSPDDSEEDDLPECEVKLEKAPDPAKEEIFATCLNFLHTHTEDELYEIVRLAFKAAEVFGY